MNMNQKGFASIILVVIIVVLVSVAGYFTFVKKSEPIAQQPTPTPIQTTTTTKTPVSLTPTPDKISTWKTYTNSQYGFEVKYPDTWKVSETAASVNFMLAKNAQDVYLSFFVYNEPISEAEAQLPLFSVPGRKIDSRTNVTINGIAWVKLVVEKNSIALLTYSNGKTYAAQYSTFENVSPQVLSTFKFTNSVSKDEFTKVTIDTLARNPTSFLSKKIQMTGKLILIGKNYFLDPRFALTDGVNQFQVSVWLVLEVPPPMPGSTGGQPLTMITYLDKTITLQGTVEQDDQVFFLMVTKAL